LICIIFDSNEPVCDLAAVVVVAAAVVVVVAVVAVQFPESD
jgi:hypothetical protein